MTVARGDVVLGRYPHAAGGRGKKRPVVVVQSDGYNATIPNMIVAEITSNLTIANDPTALLIEVATADGQATGLAQDSVVSCLYLATMSADRLGDRIGCLSLALLQRLDGCLKAALGLS